PPANEAVVAGRVRTKFIRQIAPRCARRGHLRLRLNCSFLLAVRSELLEEAPQIFGLLLVLDPRKYHFGARNLRLGIFDVFLEGPSVPDNAGIFVRIRVTVAWPRA